MFFPADSPYLADLENELMTFPMASGGHDDQVDTLVYAVLFATQRSLWEPRQLSKLPPMSMGKLMGMDKIFLDHKPDPGPFAIDKEKV